MSPRSIRFRLTAWGAGLLALMLLVFGSATYFGLERYLTASVSEQLSLQARQIADTWLQHINEAGEDYVVDEIDEHLSPHITNRFIRLTRPDGSLLYQSKPPQDQSFDPSRVTMPAHPNMAGLREEHLTGETELLIYSLPYSVAGAGSFFIEVGAPYHQIESTLHGLALIFALILPVPTGSRVIITIASEADRATIEVADTGQGIPPEALPHIFDRFYHVDKARSREHGGSGLGLAIVQSICELHEGRITVESAVDRGTRFRVEIPTGAS
ncbi:MAG: hypothetical protein HY314_16940 [Acidobacteria bacterium]|nr:hypothetical protein [Acidobacteriota bacterium]